MRTHHRLIAVAALMIGAGLSSGCLNDAGFILPTTPTITPYLIAQHYHSEFPFMAPMPVSPALTQEIEDLLERIEKDAVPILGPIRGEFAPIFCMDPPSEKDIYDTLAPIPHGVPFLFEVHRKNVRFSVEKLVDEIDPCRVYPLAGPCQLHHCHFKCTIWYDETYTMGWPIPWTHTDHKQQVLYIDKDHLHRCGEPGNLSGTGAGLESYGGYAPSVGGFGPGYGGFGQGSGPGAVGPCGSGSSGHGAPSNGCGHGASHNGCGGSCGHGGHKGH